MANLLYQGHASLRITTDNGIVIYIDPFAGTGYEIPADIVLVTHQHGDHNQIRLLKQKHDCKIITNEEALAGGVYNSFTVSGVTVEAIAAYNKNHNPKECVGFIVTADGVKIYISGDTSKTTEMESLAGKGLDYALLCCDGVYNMDLVEAAECARIIGAKHNIPVHMLAASTGGLFDKSRVESFDAPNRLILQPGQEITLQAGTKKSFRSGCIICGSPLEYFDSLKTLKCEICGKAFETTCACEKGHYVCDKCHTQQAFDFITSYALAAAGKNPTVFATEMMKNSLINMHGPEHHYLIVAALLAAYKNSGGDIDLKIYLEKALQRAKNVPGGICGMWGSCGAAIASGIFISVITGATSLSVTEWSMANAMTSRSLDIISQNGGPRCCKRNTYLAIRAAVDFVKEHKNIEMQEAGDIKCAFFHMNKQCKKAGCLFWPKANQSRNKEGIQ